MSVYDTDIASDSIGDFAKSAQGDLATSTGEENLTAALKRRFGTPYGSLFYDGTYGNKVFDRLSQSMGKNFEQDIMTDARQCLLGDPRIQSVTVRVIVDREERLVKFQVSYVAKDGTSGSFDQGWRFVFKSFEQIRDEISADIKANTDLTDTNPGSLNLTLSSVMARALRVLWFMLEQILNLFFVSTSKGSFLERRCAERSVIRKQGTKAKGAIRLARSTAAPVGSTLTKGTVMATMDGKLEFIVDADVTLPPGWTVVPTQVTCRTLGASGNLAENTPLQIVGAQIVGVQNISVASGGFSGGTDTETDEELRARYIYTIQNPQNGGTPADYVGWANSVDGVKNAVSLPLNRGPGTIDVVVTDGGIPSDALVKKVSDYIQTKRPVNADVRVIKPTAHLVPVTGTITPIQGYTLDALTPLVNQAINNYIRNVPIGGVVRVTGLIQAIMSVKGVFDFILTSPTSNINLGTTELAIFDQGNTALTFSTQ